MLSPSIITYCIKELNINCLSYEDVLKILDGKKIDHGKYDIIEIPSGKVINKTHREKYKNEKLKKEIKIKAKNYWLFLTQNKLTYELFKIIAFKIAEEKEYIMWLPYNPLTQYNWEVVQPIIIETIKEDVKTDEKKTSWELEFSIGKIFNKEHDEVIPYISITNFKTPEYVSKFMEEFKDYIKYSSEHPYLPHV